MEYDSLESVKATIGERVSKSVARATKLQLRDKEKEIYALKYHHTDVITYSPEGMTLESGGWRTTTTKERINRFSQAHISTRNWLWYVQGCAGKFSGPEYLYFDGMQVDWKGNILNPLTKSQENLRENAHLWMLRMIDHFAEHVGEMYMSGEQIFPDLWGTYIPAPEFRVSVITNPNIYLESQIRDVIFAFAHEAGFFDVAAALGIDRYSGSAVYPTTMSRDMLVNIIKKGAKRNLTRWSLIEEPYTAWLGNS